VLLRLLLLVCADPLRVMRAVRFATRFNFAPDPAILAAASSEEVSRAAVVSVICGPRSTVWCPAEVQGVICGQRSNA
jgi:hypothetical protein